MAMRPDLLAYERNGKYVLVDPESSRWIVLNSRAYAVFQDVKRAIDESGFDYERYILREPESASLLGELKRLNFIFSVDGVNAGENSPDRHGSSAAEPYMLYLEVTDRCNLDCVHCCRPHKNELSDLPISVFVESIHHFAELGGHFIRISGGEPLLRRDIRLVLEAAEMDKLPVTVLTNGTLLTVGRAEELLGFPDVTISISLDGSTAEIHNRIRGRDCFDAIRDNIETLAQRGYVKNLSLSFVPCALNVDSLEDIFRFACEYGIGRVYISVLEFGANATRHKADLELTPAQKTSVFERVKSLRSQYGKQVAVEMTGLDVGRRLSPSNRSSYSCQVGNCQLGRTLKVLPGGEVIPCPLLYDIEYSIGNVQETSLVEMIRSERMRKLAELFDDRTGHTEACQCCGWRHVCRGGCAARAIFYNGDFYSPDEYCRQYREIFEATLFSILDNRMMEMKA